MRLQRLPPPLPQLTRLRLLVEAADVAVAAGAKIEAAMKTMVNVTVLRRWNRGCFRPLVAAMNKLKLKRWNP